MTFHADILAKAAVRASQKFNRLITVETLKSKTKARSVVIPRFYAIAYVHAIGRYSLPQLARFFGFSDHTTILHALRRAHGHDGKPIQTTRYKGKAWIELEPLWKKEHFENLVFQDGFTDKAVASPDYETMIAVGERNLRRAIESLEPPLLNSTNQPQEAAAVA